MYEHTHTNAHTGKKETETGKRSEPLYNTFNYIKINFILIPCLMTHQT